MPIFDFICKKCNFKKEHFIRDESSIKKICPKCSSIEYERQISNFRMEVEYKNSYEHKKNKQDPEMRELYSQIGKEALDEDTKTLDNLFGKEKVEDTFYGSDYGNGD